MWYGLPKRDLATLLLLNLLVWPIVVGVCLSSDPKKERVDYPPARSTELSEPPHYELELTSPLVLIGSDTAMLPIHCAEVAR